MSLIEKILIILGIIITWYITINYTMQIGPDNKIQLSLIILSFFISGFGALCFVLDYYIRGLEEKLEDLKPKKPAKGQ